MNLPRRVPWASLGQLEQVYNAIYNTKDWSFAIKRLSAWKYASGLPHSLDATLSFLVASEADQNRQVYKLQVCQGYALAIIRFVNGLVDPLQTGMYARSIASIASQIGLPLAFVELRHACTHEEMPSLETLREGCQSALLWLESNYFQRILFQSSAPTSIQSLKPLEPLLKQYKFLMKQVLRDSSLRRELGEKINASLRSFDLWISEAATAAWSMWEADTNERNEWALEKLAQGLADVGGLVPVAKKKQPTRLEPTNVELWEPLLGYLKNVYPEFPSILCDAIIVAICESPEKESPSTGERFSGFYFCLSGWLLGASGCDAETVVNSVFRAVPKDMSIPKHIEQFLDEIKRREPSLVSIVNTLSQIMHKAQAKDSQWTKESLDLMQRRLELLRSLRSMDDSPQPATTEGLQGWRLLSEKTGWKPCAIGA
ncbi:Las1-domain-containing protein [Serendipita vermifera]|nr:Las1-domain-containing protein [Serendipita vermifera]